MIIFKRSLQFSGYLALRIVICIVQAMPLDTCVACSKAAAWVFSRVLRLRARLIDDNLRLAFPELSPAARQRLARQMWEHLFIIPIEVAHAPRKIHDTNWRDHLQLGEKKDIIRALLDERPTVIVSGHFGNFELGGYLLGILGFPTSTVARTLDNPYLNSFVNRFRGSTGQRIISKKGGFDDILAVLASGGTMAFLADQYAGTKGCWVDFFGRPASTHKAIALLALEHQARVCAATTRRAGKPLHFEMTSSEVVDPLDPQAPAGSVRELTQWYTSKLEEIVRLSPEQYWWVHRRWKGKPPARKKARAA